MSGLLRDARLAIRSLVRRPGTSLLIVATLAVGIGVNVSMFSVVQALLLRPLPFADADRLVRIEAKKGSEPGRVSQREFDDLLEESETLDALATFYTSQYNVTGDGPPEAVPAAINSHHLFEVLGARFVLGGPFGSTDDFRRQYRVVLEHDFWQRRFGGDPEIIGKSIVLDAGSYVVVGVLAAGSMDFPPGIKLYRQVTEYNGLDGRRHSVVGRLREGVTLQVARQELRRFDARWEQLHPETHRGIRFDVTPLRDSWVGAARPYIVALAAAVGLVLLMAVVNVVNLLLARSLERQREMAVRTSLGATRRRLIQQLLIESLLLAATAGAIGFAIAAGSLEGLRTVLSTDLPSWMGLRIEPIAVWVAAGLVLLSGTLSGLVPAFRLTSRGLNSAVRAGARETGDRPSQRLRSTLVTGQVAIALVLLLGAGLMSRSAFLLARQDLGFEHRELLTFRVDPPYWSYNEVEQLTPFYEEAMRALRAIPGVEGVAANQNLPLAGLDDYTKRLITLDGQSTVAQEGNPFIHLQSVGPGYFDVMEIGLLRGRSFTEDDRLETTPVAMVSARLADVLWPAEDPIGRRLKLGPPTAETSWLTVVGMVEDVRSERRVGPPSPDLYVSHRQHYTGDTYFALRTSVEGADLMRHAEAAIRSADADIPVFDVAAMPQRVAESEWQRQTTSVLFVFFGVLALSLAALGIYGVVSLTVSQARQEMGVRIALGARPRDLFTAVMRDGLRLFFAGTVLGLVGFAISAQLITRQLYGVEVTDPGIALGAWILLLAIAVLASLIPALRASLVNPIDSIREAGR
ncbi:MAG: ABC transporter permease [Thermoanaerobaculia bacterium]|nr:ABC transporter permease [Thermoanaerobaculia bacterium]